MTRTIAPSRLTMTMPSGAASSSPRKSLVWRYFSLGSRSPIATSEPRSVIDRGHREVDLVRDAAGVLDPGVADGDLDLVGQYGGHGDPLEVVHRLPTEVLHRVPGHRLGGDADDLAGSRVGEQDDPTGVDDHHGVVGLEHMSVERAVLPFGQCLAAAPSRSTLIARPEAVGGGRAHL